MNSTGASEVGLGHLNSCNVIETQISNRIEIIEYNKHIMYLCLIVLSKSDNYNKMAHKIGKVLNCLLTQQLSDS